MMADKNFIKYFNTILSKQNNCQHQAWIFLITCCLFISCNTGHGRIDSMGSEIIPVTTDSIIFKTDTSALTLKSYGINSFLKDNGTIFGYNYKTHSIDVFSFEKKSLMNTIPLDNEGPDAIQMSMRYIKVYSPDSIALYDDTAISIIDNTGKVVNRFIIPYNGMTRIDCNSRSNMSAFDIDFKNNRIAYPVKNGEKNTVVVYDFKNDSVVRETILNSPESNGKHGFMDYPNLCFSGDKIIYNYPYEHRICILDMTTGMTREVNHKCSLLTGGMEVLTDESPDELTWYGIENYFYSPLYYLEGKKCYVRLALDRTTLSRSEGPDRAIYARPLYLSVFNEQLEPIGEITPRQNLYDPFGGWFATPERFCLFMDNVLDDNESESTIIGMLDF